MGGRRGCGRGLRRTGRSALGLQLVTGDDEDPTWKVLCCLLIDRPGRGCSWPAWSSLGVSRPAAATMTMPRRQPRKRPARPHPLRRRPRRAAARPTTSSRSSTPSRTTDRDLKAAADAVNGSIGVDAVSIEQSTIDAVDRAEPAAVAAAIPAGLEPSVEQAVLLVYSDLVSRFAALRQGSCLYTQPRSELDPLCFSQGHAAAARMPGDVDVARAAAETSPPMVEPAATRVPQPRFGFESLSSTERTGGVTAAAASSRPSPSRFGGTPTPRSIRTLLRSRPSTARSVAPGPVPRSGDTTPPAPAGPFS